MKTGRRRLLLASLGWFTVARVGCASAATDLPMRRLGILGRSVNTEGEKAFLRTLAALGYVEGRNLIVERRSCNEAGLLTVDVPDECVARAAELVNLRVDAILAAGTKITAAAQRATRTIPIVTGCGDPVAAGFAKSLARPGGNITGVTMSIWEGYRKQIDLVRRIAPKVKLVVLVLLDSQTDLPPATLENTRNPRFKVIAREAGLPIKVMRLASTDAALFEVAMKKIGRLGGAAHLWEQHMVPGFAAIAMRHRVPTIVQAVPWVKAGWLMAYIQNIPDERIAAQLDKVLRGMDPAEIPFEMTTRWVFAVNRRTAKALGLTLGNDVLTLADEVLD